MTTVELGKLLSAESREECNGVLDYQVYTKGLRVCLGRVCWSIGSKQYVFITKGQLHMGQMEMKELMTFMESLPNGW